MEISDDLRCIFSAEVEEHGDSFVIEVPEREITIGGVTPGEACRVALLSVTHDSGNEESSGQRIDRAGPTPPVEHGERRTVDIEDIGDQGDGIARIERGYVVIVPDTDKGERVTVEITDVRENMAFATVIEREDYYE